MKKLIAFALTFFMLSGSTGVFAEVTVNSEANLRKGPGLDYDVAGSVTAGTVLADEDSIIQDDRGVDWYAVRYKGSTCWISSKISTITGSDYEPQPTSEEQSKAASASGGKKYSAIADINLRKGPGLGYDVVATVKEGTVMSATGYTQTDDRDVDWIQMNYNNVLVWASSKYLNSGTGSSSSGSKSSSSSVSELSPYCNKSLKNAADALGLTNRENVSGELSYQYRNSRVIIQGNDKLSAIILMGSGLKLYGAEVGMRHYDAANACISSGLRMKSLSSGNFTLEHYNSGSSSPDSVVSILFDMHGTVTDVMWFTYTS